jgi:hypothetical protein
MHKVPPLSEDIIQINTFPTVVTVFFHVKKSRLSALEIGQRQKIAVRDNSSAVFSFPFGFHVVTL